MPEYLDDPSVLTKDKLKSELLANNVELPSGNPTKDVYVQLYLKNLTAQNKQHVAATILDAFSSDEELPPPVVSNRSRSSGRKATRKTDKVRPDELDVTVLTDEGLRDQLLKHGVDVGPIVATTRKLYEKKLQKLLDEGPAQTQLVPTEIQVNHNGNSESDLYSDKEDEVTTEPEPEPTPEPVAEPEPVPVVERTVRSRGKTAVTGRTRSSQHHTRDLVMNEDNDEDSVLNVKRRSRGFYQRTTLTEDLRPVLTDQDQSVSNVPVYLKPVEAEPSSTPSRPAQSKSLAEEQCSRRSAKPSSPLAGSARVHPITFSPMRYISPIKSQESHWAGSDQAAPKPSSVHAVGKECAPPDVRLHRERQLKITSLMSKCSYTAPLSRDKLSGQVEKIAAAEQNTKVDETDVLKELFPNDLNSPTGISATCRRPIRGAAGRPVNSSDLWNNENSLFSPKTTTKSSSSSSSYTEARNSVTSLPSSTPSTFSTSFSSSSSSSRLLAAAPPAGQKKAVHRGLSLWIKLFLLAIVAAFLFLVYQAMETNTDAPFGGSKVSSNSRA